MTARETVPCELCGKQTTMTGTKRCDGCWELEGRIHRDPVLARRILAEFDKAAAPGAPQQEASGAEHIADFICRSVAELPDRNSPEDWPDAMLVTSDELREIVCEALAFRAAATAPAGGVTDLQKTFAEAMQVLDFLAGTGELEGCGFSGKPAGLRGPYWWRPHLTKIRAALQAARAAEPEPTHWLVLAPCGEGVVFDNKRDAKWAQTGRGAGSDGFGTPVIGEAFRDAYKGEKFALIPLTLLAASPTPPTTKDGGQP